MPFKKGVSWEERKGREEEKKESKTFQNPFLQFH